MFKVVVLGSTGSLGRICLNVIEEYSDQFELVGISANQNAALLEEQKDRFALKKAILASGFAASEVDKLASLSEADIVVNLISGVAGISPGFAALKSAKKLVLANKESIVASDGALGPYLDQIIPVDSEHNAIFEIIANNPGRSVSRIYLPCSGGPFLHKTKEELANVNLRQTLSHPKWKMGKKISVESATLLNKGLEVIEAHYLFNLPLEKIEVFLRPECDIHGIVEFEDGQKLAYYGTPSMSEHLENALLRAASLVPPPSNISELAPDFIFTAPDYSTFPGIEIVLSHFQKSPAKMKEFLEREEKIIGDFLSGHIKFLEIFDKLR